MNRTASVITLILIAGVGLGLSYWLQRSSAPQIAVEQRLLDSRQLLDVLATDAYDNQPLEQPLTLADTALSNSTLLGGYRASKAGQPVAVLLRTQTEGYAGAIELLVAIDTNGRLLGVKTLRQNETPALGGHLGDWPNAWLATFTGTSRSAPDDAGWALKKDRGQFDQLAGATITSRATVNAIHDALRYFDQHRATLLGIAP
jgi:electron transport complex protein RnfG